MKYNYHILEQMLMLAGMIFLSITIVFCLLRAILGPRFTDRIVAVNVICVKTVTLIAILSMYLGENYLLDVALVYASINFLSTIVLARLFLNNYLKNVQNKYGGD